MGMEKQLKKNESAQRVSLFTISLGMIVSEESFQCLTVKTEMARATAGASPNGLSASLWNSELGQSRNPTIPTPMHREKRLSSIWS